MAGRLVAVLLLVGAIERVVVGGPAASEAQSQRDFNRRQLNADSEEPGEDTGQLSESLAFAIASASSSSANSNFQCERITFQFCASMPYNFTRMANFFGDASQFEAAERAKQYELLARSHCSHHLLSYLCELLAPMCLDGEAMKRFEIFPCRSFCRQVSRDCETQISALYGQYNLQVPAAFNCEQLPYESNGGSGGGLRGPCHETPELPAPPMSQQQPTGIATLAHSQPQSQSQSQSQLQLQSQSPMNRQQQHKPANTYWPYQKDDNMPPYVDNSPIDSRVIRPASVAEPAPTLAQPPASPTRAVGSSQTHTGAGPQLWMQAQSVAQQLAAMLLKHSNLLSLLTLVCLVLVLNAKRLRRAKQRLAGVCLASSSSSSSRKSSSSASSSGSQRKLASGQKLALSPSSSSRSLMLIAGCGGGAAERKRAPAGHKLVNCAATSLALERQLQAEPSQALFQQAGAATHKQRTLINVNGTLERQHRQLRDSESARYQLMQSLNTNGQPVAVLAHPEDQQSLKRHQQQHQYDYIQVNCAPSPVTSGRKLSSKSSGRGSSSVAASANEREIYSNILLSSPSHQILLFADGQHHQTAAGQFSSQRPRPNDDPPPPPSTLPPPLHAQVQQQQQKQKHKQYLNGSGTNSPYAALFEPLEELRRANICGSLTSSLSRGRRASQETPLTPTGLHGQSLQAQRLVMQSNMSGAYASSATSSSSSSASSSGGSAFSPPCGGQIAGPPSGSLMRGGCARLN